MVKSAKGREINMQALMIANQKTVALGNAKMNARGDILGKNGKIVKTREQLAQEYNKNPANKVVNVPVTSTSITQPTKPRDIKNTATPQVKKKHTQKPKQ